MKENRQELQKKRHLFLPIIFKKHNTGVLKIEAQEEISRYLDEIHQLELPIKKTRYLLKTMKNHVSPNKALFYALITRKFLQELPEKDILFLTQMFKTVTRLNFFPP